MRIDCENRSCRASINAPDLTPAEEVEETAQQMKELISWLENEGWDVVLIDEDKGLFIFCPEHKNLGK